MNGAKSRYDLTPEAEQDLTQIANYIAQDNVVAAQKVLSELQGAMEALSGIPEMGHSREDLTDKAVRFWSVRSYLIVYRPEMKPLQVIRVVSGFRDVAELLR